MVCGAIVVAVAIGWPRARERGLAKAARLFIPVWLVATLANVTIGVVSAGYTAMQELPVLIVTFTLPAVAAWATGKRIGASRVEHDGS